MSWTAKHFNRFSHYTTMRNDGAITNREYFRYILNECAISPWACMIIGSLWATGEFPEWMDFVFSPFESLLAAVPLARDVSGYFRYGTPIGSSTAFVGATRAAEAVASPFQALNGNKEWGQVLWDFGKMAEYVAKVPAMKAFSDIKRVYDNIKEE
jgi:hypothetical protein